MRFLYVSLLLLLNTIKLHAQEPMGSMWEITACEKMPCEMLSVQKWIDKTVKPLFVAGLQTSNSYWGDNNSISFSLSGQKSLNIVLPNTGGIQLKFGDAYPPKIK